MACPAYIVHHDADLVRGTAAGDNHAFDTLYRRYRRRVLAFAAKRLGDYYEAEDVTQEVFLEVYRCIESYQGRSSLLSWILGIARNRVRHSFRRRNPVLLPLDIPEVRTLAAPQPRLDRQVEVHRMLERAAQVVSREMTPIQRDVFHLRYGENRSTHAIARQLGKSDQAVKTSLCRSRRALAHRAAGSVESLLEA